MGGCGKQTNKTESASTDNSTYDFSQKGKQRNEVVVGGLYWDEGRL